MKTRLLVVLIAATLASLMVVVMGSVVSAFALVFAYALTLMLDGMDMRQAMTPGAILAGSSLFFCYKLFASQLKRRLYVGCQCDECSALDDHGGYEDTVVTPPSPMLKGAGMGPARRSPKHPKGPRGTTEKR